MKSILYNAIMLIFIGLLSFSDDPAYHPENGSDGSELEDDASGKCPRNDASSIHLFQNYTRQISVDHLVSVKSWPRRVSLLIHN